MPQLIYTEAELLREHDYAAMQVECGRRCHGGFDEQGRYISPRSLIRGPAIEAWSDALRRRDGDLLAADASLLAGVRYPSPAQAKLLLREGVRRPFWNNLTITGRIEARGRLLAEIPIPDFQAIALSDISETALGHLHKGLLKAHGLDEGGEPEAGIGGHDTMWFTLRDLAFGDTGFEEPPEPPNIARPEEAQRSLPPIPDGHARMIYFLLNLLLIEFRAELGFDLSERLLTDPELFADRRGEADRAAEIVRRIRQDEEIHVTSLRLVLGEIRQLDFRTHGGGRISGTEIVDDFWQAICKWATLEQPIQNAEAQRDLYHARIAEHPEAERVQRAFDALEEPAGGV